MAKNDFRDFGTCERKVQDFLRGAKRFRLFASNENKSPMVVALVDGRNFHGGFTDRIKGIVSLFHFCLVKNMDFRILYNFPFELSDYLEPNEYNWLIDDKSVPSNFFRTSFVNLVGDASIDRLKELNVRKSVVAYANRDVTHLLNEFYGTSYTWGQLYHRLFKPSAKLQQQVDYHSNILGDDYVAVHFRFVGMFGDFNESPFVDISEQQKEHILRANIDFLDDMAKRFTDRKIFVASDSSFFIDNIKHIGNVYALSGDIQHIDNRMNANKEEAFMRLLLDFYLIAGSSRVYSVATDKMYRSELPMYAAKLYDVDFERIIL